MLDPTTTAMERFLAGVERRAFKMAEYATGNREDALDIVQDSMLTLVHRYGDRSVAEWPPLFQSILQSRINDWRRRSSVRNRVRAWFASSDNENEDGDEWLQQVADEQAREPSTHLASVQAMEGLEAALRALPLRQQQAFLLRAWEGLDVKQTAEAMRCSEGSVKTHYFRALQTLRTRMGEHRP